MTDIPGIEQTQAKRVEQLRDLEQRIQELTVADESAFGPFNSRDWIFCVMVFVVLPYLFYLWFWP